MGKGFNQPPRYAEAVERIHDQGIGIMGTFIVGLDDDDPEVFQRIIDFCVDERLDWALTFIISPYPRHPFLSPIRKGRESFPGIGKNMTP